MFTHCKRLYAVVVWMLFLQPVSSQYYFYNEKYFDAPLLGEVSFSAGGMNCLTDLGGVNRATGFGRDVNWKATRLAATFSAGLLFQGILGARLEISVGRITAADSLLPFRPASYGRRMRNLQFQSTIKDLAFIVAFHPLAMPGIAVNGPPGISPYIFAGIGFFTFKPEAVLNQVVVDLHSLHTEGQGFADYPDRHPYSLRQWNLPLGIGIRWEASVKASFRLELNYRKLWTDYLDDVSKTYIDPALFRAHLDNSNARIAGALSDRSLKTDPLYSTRPGQIRGNDQNNDAFFTFQAGFSIVLGRTRRW